MGVIGKKKYFTNILFIIGVFLVSCGDKKDTIEIYLTKNTIESYDAVPLKVAIKDSLILKNIIDSYGDKVRVDTISNKLIYMGHFLVEERDLEETPFIADSEILGFDFENSEIHFSKIVGKNIYNELRKRNNTLKLSEMQFVQFVLCYNGKIVLNGYFVNMTGRYNSSTYQIVFHDGPELKRKDGIKSISFSMTDSLNFEKNFLKKNKEFYNVFKNRIINQSIFND